MAAMDALRALRHSRLHLRVAGLPQAQRVHGGAGIAQRRRDPGLSGLSVDRILVRQTGEGGGDGGAEQEVCGVVGGEQDGLWEVGCVGRVDCVWDGVDDA